MLDHVGQRFLDHPVDGQVQSLGQFAWRRGHGQVHGQARGPDPGDQGGNLGQARLRAQRVVIRDDRGGGRRAGPGGFGGREQAEQVPQLGHRGPAAGLDGLQGRTRIPG